MAKIMVVDGNRLTRSFLLQVLGGLGHKDIVDLDDGNAALGLLRLETFDLVIADFKLPGMSGPELLKAVRAEQSMMQVPVVLCADNRNRTAVEEAMESGARFFLLKPYTGKAVHDLIEKTLEKQKRIMVVDDAPPARIHLRNLLQSFGFNNIVEAQDGQLAYEYLLENEVHFVISDWNMPGLNGLELAKAIRGNSDIKQMPILMVSAEIEKGKILAAMKNGVNDYLLKPFNKDKFKAKFYEIFLRPQK